MSSHRPWGQRKTLALCNFYQFMSTMHLERTVCGPLFALRFVSPFRSVGIS
jgi:hypothetical protein